MILQALAEYYERKAADPQSEVAPEGFERRKLEFVVVLNEEGRLVQIEDTREQVGTKLVGREFVVPRSWKRQGPKAYSSVFLLWDHIGYLFEHAGSDSEKDIERARNQHQTWLAMLESLPTELQADAGVAAVKAFYQNEGLELIKADPLWPECTKSTPCNMTFRLAGDAVPVPCRPAVVQYVRNTVAASGDDEQAVMGRCLVSGQIGPVARTHGQTSINKDTKSLVAFQRASGYDSYGKEQCYNAPISKSAEFAYVTGLNTLLRSDSQRMSIGDAVVVFWASRASTLEQQMGDFFTEPQKDDPDRNTRAVADLLSSVRSGIYVREEKDVRFYVLGLAPNSARISVRFWHTATVPEMAECFAWHFEDICIVHGPKEPDALSLFRLLSGIATQGKSENIPPNLVGETMRAILSGGPYPQTLLQAAIRRNRAEQHVTYARAALIKACLNRAQRFNNRNQKEELTMSLDELNTNIGYRLGRLFAALEKIQSESHPGINSTIRDRFYGAASSTPVTVFANLIKLSNHHLAKLENPGRKVNLERLLGEIMGAINDFPAHLAIEDQGRFHIGYYHQNQAFYAKKEKQD